MANKWLGTSNANNTLHQNIVHFWQLNLSEGPKLKMIVCVDFIQILMVFV